jgi:hypothetical protein
MKLMGYQIREALRRWGMKRDMASSQFEGSLKKFDDEDKADPNRVMNDFMLADEKIARLQLAQDIYNLGVTVTIKSRVGTDIKHMSLAQAVKLVGGAGRAEKMWRSAANPSKDRYSTFNADDVRKEGEVRSKPVMAASEMMRRAEEISRYASSLRAAMATGNAVEIEVAVEGLETSDLA